MLNLEVMRQRCDAATPGPWSTANSPDDVYGGRASSAFVGGKARLFRHNGDVKYAIADCRFVAHAREDLPACIAEIERLRAALMERGERLQGAAPSSDDAIVRQPVYQYDIHAT